MVWDIANYSMLSTTTCSASWMVSSILPRVHKISVRPTPLPNLHEIDSHHFQLLILLYIHQITLTKQAQHCISTQPSCIPYLY